MRKPKYCVWDIETGTTAYAKQKASPFGGVNKVIASGYAFEDGSVQADYGRTGLSGDWFRKVLAAPLLVGHNIKFDLLHAIQDPENYAAYQQWVAGGGQVWDTQLAEYLLEGQDRPSHMTRLEDLSIKYGGSCKVNEVKALWEAGVDTCDIDKDLLLRYLVGDDDGDGDIGNTRTVFKAQLARARESRQTKLILMNCGALLYTVEAEHNGMVVDKQLGLEIAAELEEQLAAAEARLNAHLPDDLPFEFNWNSTTQKSAIIFGGQVKYTGREYILPGGGTVRCDQYHPEADGPLDYVMKEEEHAVTDEDGNPVTFKSGKRQGEVKTKKVKVPDLTKPKARNCDAFYSFPGYTKPRKEWAGSVEGVWSTAGAVIETLAGKDVPFLDDLAEVASISKDLGTYFIRTDSKGAEKGMLTLVGEDGVIHHSLNMTSTVTGRLSSSNPNLQNLSKEGKSRVKELFVSRFGEDGQIIQSDFSSLEVYVQANLTLCDQLLDDLRAGMDMHCVRVSQTEGVPYEVALDRCKNRESPYYKEWDKKRTAAKVFSFRRAYGAGAQTIADGTGMSLEEVEALIAAEETRYPEIVAYFNDVEAKIKASRVPTSIFTQHPDFPAMQCQLGKGYFTTPDNKLYVWRESPAPKFLAKRGTTTSFSPPEIKNYPVQGAGGEWAKAAMWLAVRAFYGCKNFDGKAALVNQVHDANYADAHKDVAYKAAVLLHACMEEASTFMEYYYGWQVAVPVPSDTTIGASMAEDNAIENPKFPEHVKAARSQLRTQFMEGYTPSFEKE